MPIKQSLSFLSPISAICLRMIGIESNGRETCFTWLDDGELRTHLLECLIEALETGCAAVSSNSHISETGLFITKNSSSPLEFTYFSQLCHHSSN